MIEALLYFSEKSGPFHQHSALTSPVQSWDEQSFSFHRGKGCFYLLSQPTRSVAFLPLMNRFNDNSGRQWHLISLDWMCL